MKKRRVLALVGEGLIPPESVESPEARAAAEWRMEFDVVRTLRRLKHEVRCLGVSHDLKPIRDAVEEFDPHIVFNMLEDFHGNVFFDQNVVSYLELLKKPYTGCNPRGLVLAKDKGLAKKILSYHRIRVPDFTSFRRGQRIRIPRRLEFPLIVKSLVEESSTGISQASIVHNNEQLKSRVEFVFDQVGTDALAEEYIEGRELYLAVLGNQRLQTFPIWELLMDKLPEGAPRIATARIKFNREYQKKYNIRTRAAKDIPEDLAKRIQRTGKRVYKVLEMSGYGRLDLRLREDGTVFVIEANPNPDLSKDEDFALSAAAVDVKYPGLITKILNTGFRRHHTWQ